MASTWVKHTQVRVVVTLGIAGNKMASTMVIWLGILW
jgi:hypothetical protein